MRRRGRPPKGALPPEDDMLECLIYWKRAAESTKGIAIASDFPNRLLQKLYRARREVGGFENLYLVETETEVWIVPR